MDIEGWQTRAEQLASAYEKWVLAQQKLGPSATGVTVETPYTYPEPADAGPADWQTRWGASRAR